MANIIIKSDERRAQESHVLKSFGKGGSTSRADREAAECVAARTQEAYGQLKKMEGDKR